MLLQTKYECGASNSECAITFATESIFIRYFASYKVDQYIRTTAELRHIGLLQLLWSCSQFVTTELCVTLRH